MDIIELEETASTNTMLRQMPDAPHATVLSAKRQSAGRGQRGNTWEAEPGANLTFSILVRRSQYLRQSRWQYRAPWRSP